ncbi:hypothetical protein SAMN02982929_07192 [Saccharopolyspora kobensis]|uniref:Uncharacterized protein n=1 Tax=Saccharopolyspora kobensis TaxID=146035 RepID=A0A1H6ENW9_9PSEU|nr:hypothetical protein [Saccharopolyspora kobensis]SEG98706.1 hypothetical protein SAMN02982929_07192 [Saccharopolyspora kobensis]SFD23643.1 hypothetical protein SAMN05216506_103177 [Saccharopolyspora kobensis]
MPRFRIPMRNTVHYTVEVEADSLETAREVAEIEGLPGLMMLDHRYPDESGWEVYDAEDRDEDEAAHVETVSRAIYVAHGGVLPEQENHYRQWADGYRDMARAAFAAMKEDSDA